jgi:hypothetical protein
MDCIGTAEQRTRLADLWISTMRSKTELSGGSLQFEYEGLVPELIYGLFSLASFAVLRHLSSDVKLQPPHLNTMSGLAYSCFVCGQEG